jgi:hypothetical protein
VGFGLERRIGNHMIGAQPGHHFATVAKPKLTPADDFLPRQFGSPFPIHTISTA